MSKPTDSYEMSTGFTESLKPNPAMSLENCQKNIKMWRENIRKCEEQMTALNDYDLDFGGRRRRRSRRSKTKRRKGKSNKSKRKR